MTPEGGSGRFSDPKLDRFLGAQWKMARFHDEHSRKKEHEAG
jgi:hypothetical protein